VVLKKKSTGTTLPLYFILPLKANAVRNIVNSAFRR